MEIMRIAKRSPEAYYLVPSPILPKVDKLKHEPQDDKPFNLPEKHRMLAVFSAIYRVESGATFRQHVPWLQTWLHPTFTAASLVVR